LDHPDPIGILRQGDDHARIQSPLPRPSSLQEILDRIPAQFRIRSCLQWVYQIFLQKWKTHCQRTITLV